ncbi:MAG: hypothetical protein ACREPT_09115 [Rudaea sp.]
MIFRRFAGNLRKQDWTAVAVELVVVVVGVFIGLQASNWNDDRQTDAKAAIFTKSLTADLRDEAWGYQYQIDYYNDVLANAERTIDALTGAKPLSDEALLISAYRATQYHTNIRRRATYDELKSTGLLGLIRSDALRDTAIQVYTSPTLDMIAAESQTSLYRKTFRMAIPNEIQQSLEHACGDRVVRIGDYRAIVHSLDYPCSTGLPTQTIAASAAILRADSQLPPLLRLRIANLETDLGNLTLYDNIRDELRAIAKEKP